MILRQFFNLFDQLDGAPNAIPRLRDIVFDLALSGKLVEPDLNTTSSGRLVQAAEAEKDRLIGDGLIRQPRRPKPVGNFVPTGVIPNNWTWTCLFDLGLIAPRNDVSDDSGASFIPMPGIPQRYGNELTPETRKWSAIKTGFTHFADGDVVMAKITPCFQNGKSAVIDGLENGVGAGTTELHVFRPLADSVVPQYVLIFLKSRRFLSDGVPFMTGSAGQKRIPTGYFALLPFPLPPLAEQKRIVAKVDQLMALCDRLEAQQQERESQHTHLTRAALARFHEQPSSANLNLLFHKSFTIPPADLRKTILQLAVQGKLVNAKYSVDCTTEAVGKLRELSQSQANEEGLRNRKPTNPINRNTYDFVFPERWALPQFDDIGVTVSGITKGRRISGKVAPHPYLRVANVQRGHVDLRVMKDIEITADELEKYRLKSGDVLMTEGGDWDKLGRAAIWHEEIPDCIHQNHVYRVRSASAELLIPQWIVLYANSPVGRAYFESCSKQTTNLASMNMTQLRSSPLPLPSAEEQKQIIAKVESLMKQVDHLEAQLTQSRATAEKLMEAIVAQLTRQTV